jgi:1,4-alpha-glucan branching enzyme
MNRLALDTKNRAKSTPGKKRLQTVRNPKRTKAGRIKIHFEPAEALLRRIEFNLRAPAAGSVKLAGDFTAWDTLPLCMKADAHGRWMATVPLTPGEYAYRFIIDGKWSDDPAAERWVANPFGTLNAVKEVA